MGNGERSSSNEGESQWRVPNSGITAGVKTHGHMAVPACKLCLVGGSHSLIVTPGHTFTSACSVVLGPGGQMRVSPQPLPSRNCQPGRADRKGRVVTRRKAVSRPRTEHHLLEAKLLSLCSGVHKDDGTRWRRERQGCGQRDSPKLTGETNG